MFIYRLVKEYRKQFEFKNVLSRNIRANRWILLYLFFSLIFPIAIGVLFYLKELMIMLISAIIYVIILYIGGEQHKKRMIEVLPVNSLGYNVQPFKEMLRNKFNITTDEQLIILDEIIRRELYLRESNRKYPFADIGKQLFVAILTTGLLSYVFLEIRAGNLETATNLFAIYIVCLTGILMLGGIIKQFKDFGSSSNLNDISYLIQLLLLENSINKNECESVNDQEDYIGLPPRKMRLNKKKL
ncbi:hypothetical protein DZB84_20485 [Bacillus sp. HNG]|uniref:hypothetical protein n=1 Tax=Bacillus sp. HNG TaxID=2293325 RepID=UPI000E2FAF40|nr:hypothetical protein [Bacillus sp. HNG]RFB11447.1 hypothetical protein DZB84_20485 [Bacillus sp. HNG]